jgi:hypothetical protein
MKPSEVRSQKSEVRRWRGRCGFGSAVCLLTSALLSGCLGITGNNNRTSPPPPAAARINETPTAGQLLGYLNRNAEKIQSLEVGDLDLDIAAGRQSVGVNGTLFCQQPRYFRMKAKKIGKDVADIGSNEQEFWFWISEDNPPDLRHCTYADLTRGVRLPFPLQPEWAMEALGLARYDATRPQNFRVEVKPDAFELVEQTTSPSGEAVRKVTVFEKVETVGTRPQVKALKLYDAQGRNLIAQATITSVRRDPMTQAVIPYKVEMSWPAQQLKLKMTLEGMALNTPKSNAATNPVVYSRPVLKNIRSYDLARGTYDTPPAAIQRTGGVFRRGE